MADGKYKFTNSRGVKITTDNAAEAERLRADAAFTETKASKAADDKTATKK